MSQSLKSDRISESTIARMAGNIYGSVMTIRFASTIADVAAESVAIARAIVAEVERTAAPKDGDQ